MKSVPVRPASQTPPATSAASADDLHAGEPRAWLSALADGDAQAAQQACNLWRDDEDARQTWHAYHLIGDVMRSDELAARPARDAAFLAGVRSRLAAEPVVLAPADPVRRRQPWLVPAAAAAGFVVVAGVLVVTRVGLPGAQPGAAVFATASGPAGRAVQMVSDSVRPAQPAQRVGGGQIVIRDARLDEYLRVHQAARGGVAVAAPGGSLRPSEVAQPVSAGR